MRVHKKLVVYDSFRRVVSVASFLHRDQTLWEPVDHPPDQGENTPNSVRVLTLVLVYSRKGNLGRLPRHGGHLFELVHTKYN